MAKWIHNTMYITDLNTEAIVKQLDEVATDGWEIVSIVPMVGVLVERNGNEPTRWEAQSLLVVMKMPEDQQGKR